MLTFDLGKKVHDASIILDETIIIKDKEGVSHEHQILLTAEDAQQLYNALLNDELNEFESVDRIFNIFNIPGHLLSQFTYNSKFALCNELGSVVKTKLPSDKKINRATARKSTKR
jgi:hypothetical protein